MAKPAYQRAGFATPNAYRKAVKQARAWSAEHSRADTSKWSDTFTPEQKGAYYRAYISPTTGMKGRGLRGLSRGGPALRYWLISENYYNLADFLERYEP